MPRDASDSKSTRKRKPLSKLASSGIASQQNCTFVEHWSCLTLWVEVVVCVELCDDVEVLGKAGHKLFDLGNDLLLGVVRLSSKRLSLEV